MTLHAFHSRNAAMEPLWLCSIEELFGTRIVLRHLLGNERECSVATCQTHVHSPWPLDSYGSDSGLCFHMIIITHRLYCSSTVLSSIRTR